MKKSLLYFILAALPVVAMAQTAPDAFQLSRSDLRGTARYMSMGGAFTALGGDLSTLNNNPAGIGLYRKSEVGITMDIDMQGASSQTSTQKTDVSQTKVYLNNIGYIGALRLTNETVPYFQWGASYGRVASFDRAYRGVNGAMNTSLSNYIAGYTSKKGWTGSELTGTTDNYFSYQAPWLSMLAYNSYIMNAPSGSTGYSGMWQNGTTGTSTFDVVEKGYVDEYSINFGGNILNNVYFGIGFGVTDIEYSQSTYYTEDMSNARIPNQRPATSYDNPDDVVDNLVVDGVTNGDGGFGLDSYKRITGTGFNFKAGVIVKPINELRIGLAIHTPTYYSLRQVSNGTVDYGYGYTSGPAKASYSGTPNDYVDFKLQTPWRLQAGIATVIGSKAIVSVDYEYRPYQSMTLSDQDGDNYNYLNSDIKTYYQTANIVRAGAEYRASNHFSLRIGGGFESCPTKTDVKNGLEAVYTSNPDDTGVNPSYSLSNTTRYITAGIGYHSGGFYLDAAYVNKHNESTFHAFTPNQFTPTPDAAKTTFNSNNIVLSFGYKF